MSIITTFHKFKMNEKKLCEFKTNLNNYVNLNNFLQILEQFNQIMLIITIY
jgi:hypothetical protein